jgi:hypothetical protein
MFLDKFVLPKSPILLVLRYVNVYIRDYLEHEDDAVTRTDEARGREAWKLSCVRGRKNITEVLPITERN